MKKDEKRTKQTKNIKKKVLQKTDGDDDENTEIDSVSDGAAEVSDDADVDDASVASDLFCNNDEATNDADDIADADDFIGVAPFSYETTDV